MGGRYADPQRGAIICDDEAQTFSLDTSYKIGDGGTQVVQVMEDLTLVAQQVGAWSQSVILHGKINKPFGKGFLLSKVDHNSSTSPLIPVPILAYGPELQPEWSTGGVSRDWTVQSVDLDIIIDGGTPQHLSSAGDLDFHFWDVPWSWAIPAGLPALGQSDYSAYDVKIIVNTIKYLYVWVPPGGEGGGDS
jgi:hypothetical protein